MAVLAGGLAMAAFQVLQVFVVVVFCAGLATAVAVFG